MSSEAAFLDSPIYHQYHHALLSSAEQPEMRPDRSANAAATKTNKRVASKVAPRLYLTCLATARDATQLANLGITHVVSAIEDAPTFPSSHPLRTLHVSVSDYDGEDILSHLPATTSFIRGALAESPTNRVLVHCFMGISRSTTVVVAFLIATTNMTPREALAAVRSKRAIVRPNRGFMSQLQEYYTKSSNSLQAELTDEPPEKSDGKRRKNLKTPWGHGIWSPRRASENRDGNAQTAVNSLLSLMPQPSLGGRESWKFEKHIF
ncbi:protein-tyrosine phosphatase-like protein [Russula earlei]|uniref:Protein-tyrosine phosphatase-like protein n=1 Tax=Russula earlei TaxID=71964 RepID=A0ACC0UHF5_9AGAM|nr:protein-tyrosine phosphatase-like protein [Russula earlei]